MLKGAALDRFLLQKQGRHWDGVPVPHVALEDLDDRALFWVVFRVVMGQDCAAYSLPAKAELPVPGWKPVPGGRLRQVKVRYGKGPVKVAKGTKITLPVDAWVAFKDLRLEQVEVFRVAFLDSGNRLMAYEDVARGTVDHVAVHPREVYFSAVHLRASGLICFHNHLGQRHPQPSEEDFGVTLRLLEAGEVMGIRLLDHIIVGLEGYYSFNDHYLL